MAPIGGADERRGEADHQRGARAIDHAREDVAAVGVGAAPVLPRRRARGIAGEIDRQRIIGRDPFREDAGEHHQEDDDEADRAERLLAAEFERWRCARRGLLARRVGAAMVMASGVPDARIEHRVEQVDDQIDQHVERRDQHHHALDQREVVARNALHEQLADAVQVEHLLGDDEAADQEGEFERRSR